MSTTLKFFLSILVALMAHPLSAQDVKSVLVKGGTFTPLYGSGENKKATVNDFYMDITPVTNEQFRDFVKKKVNGKNLP